MKQNEVRVQVKNGSKLVTSLGFLMLNLEHVRFTVHDITTDGLVSNGFDINIWHWLFFRSTFYKSHTCWLNMFDIPISYLANYHHSLSWNKMKSGSYTVYLILSNDQFHSKFHDLSRYPHDISLHHIVWETLDDWDNSPIYYPLVI